MMRSLTCTFLPEFPSRKSLQSLLLRLIIKNNMSAFQACPSASVKEHAPSAKYTQNSCGSHSHLPLLERTGGLVYG